MLKNSTPKILLVDDKPENIAILVTMLEPLNLELFVALNANDLYRQVELYDFDLILLDIIMPDVTGYEICKQLKSKKRYADIPIIFVSALSSVEDKIKGFSYGVDDYITKPLLAKELTARVTLHLQKGMLYKSLKQLLRKSYHELYNPLSVINTSLEMQKIKYNSTKYTDAITVAARTLQIVYDDLYYSLSNDKQTHNAIDINLVEYVQKRIDYFHYLQQSKSVTISFTYRKTSYVHIKENDLQRVIDNTISNAIKYADKDSLISIEIFEEPEKIIFKSQNYGSEIKDTSKIFNNGYRENYEKIGMGVGLEIVASICKQNNIETLVSSQDGRTLFQYKLPKISYKA
jgi:DNA-binding response OmpR family regulator